MRKFIATKGNSKYYVDTANEIKGIFKSIKRANKEGRANLHSFFVDVEFNPYKIYGLKVTANNYFAIINGEDILYLLITGEIK